MTEKSKSGIAVAGTGLLMIFAGSLSLGQQTGAIARKAETSKPARTDHKSSSKTNQPHDSDTARRVAEALDKAIQPRFLVDVPGIGTERILTVAGHSMAFFSGGERYKPPVAKPNETPLEARNRKYVEAMAETRQMGHEFHVGFLHITHASGNPDDPKIREYSKPLLTHVLSRTYKSEEGFNALSEAVQLAATEALPVVRKRNVTDFIVPDKVAKSNYFVLMRAVRASDKACLNCHKEAKRGDLLGVMVYAIEKNRSSWSNTEVSSATVTPKK